MNKLADLFDGKCRGEIPFDIRQQDLSSRNYLICITPRSGSTWLTRLLNQTNILGNPDEWFNPESMKNIVQKYKCANIFEYVDTIRRKEVSSNGVFGVEMSYYHLKFLTEILTIEQVFGRMPIWFYLRRKNFVLQGISLYLSVASGYFHSYQTDNDKRDKYFSIEYEPNEIKKWCKHIIDQEKGFNDMFLNYEIEPIRIFYEDIIADKARTVRLFCNVMGEKCAFEDPGQEPLERIGTKRNYEWEEKFRQEHSDFVEKMFTERTKIDDLTRSNAEAKVSKLSLNIGKKFRQIRKKL